MSNDNKTMEQVALSDRPLPEQLRIIRDNYSIGSGEFDALDEAADVVECQQRKIAELNNKIASYERLLAASPCGVIYQLGICNQDGDVMNGIGILFNNEEELAKMPRVGYGDRFYIVPLEQAKIVKGVQNEPEQH